MRRLLQLGITLTWAEHDRDRHSYPVLSTYWDGIRNPTLHSSAPISASFETNQARINLLKLQGPWLQLFPQHLREFVFSPRSNRIKKFSIPDNACIINGRIYSSKLLPPAHAATSTMLSKNACRKSQSRSFKYVIMWLKRTSLVFCLPRKIQREEISCKTARLTMLDGSMRSAERCSWILFCKSCILTS
jgi:hypothetical protein